MPVLAPKLVPWKPAVLARPRASITRPISATVLTRNSRRHLGAVLEALQWCDEIVVLDTGSSDDTLDIARGFANCSVHRLQGEFLGFGAARRQAVNLARHDWILSIDSDEIVPPDLAQEIIDLELDPRAIYSFGFHTYIGGRLLRPPRWYLERHRRMFNRRATTYSESVVHEHICPDGLRTVRLQHPVRHYSYDSPEDLLRKIQVYSSLFAQMQCGRQRSGPLRACLHAAAAFMRHYVMKGAVFQGFDGFVVSVFHANITLWKYLKLHDANRLRLQK